MKKNIIIIILVIILVVMGILLLVNRKTPYRKEQVTSETEKKTGENPFQTAEIEVDIIESENNSFGYRIIVDGSVMIIQPNRPGLPGNEGFENEEQARKVGELVVNKIREGNMPPTITLDELKALGVI